MFPQFKGAISRLMLLNGKKEYFTTNELLEY